jgi:Tol biopolymer transport system component
MHRRGSRITVLTGLAVLTLSMLASPAGAAFPGRNGRIVVPSNRSGNFELWTVKANGTGWRQLSDHPAFDACPAWSPDGTTLAFCSDRTGSLQVFTMHADGSGVRQVSHGLASALFPEWSPDGSRLVFEGAPAEDTPGDLYVVRADGSGQHPITADPAQDGEPAWSPDGRRIAFDRIGAGGIRDPFIVTVNHPKVRAVTDDPFSELAPSWQPLPR